MGSAEPPVPYAAREPRVQLLASAKPHAGTRRYAAVPDSLTIILGTSIQNLKTPPLTWYAEVCGGTRQYARTQPDSEVWIRLWVIGIICTHGKHDRS